jgi:elongation factor Tu
VLSAAEGGRRTPFAANYRPQFHFRTSDVVGVVALAPGVAVVRPGEAASLTVELGQPVPMSPGLGFAMREGRLTVAAGTVTEVLD